MLIIFIVSIQQEEPDTRDSKIIYSNSLDLILAFYLEYTVCDTVSQFSMNIFRAFLLFCCSLNCTRAEINGNVLADELTRVIEDVGYTQMQKHLNRLQYTESMVDYPSVTRKTADSIQYKFQEMEQALGNLKTTIEEEYKLFSSQMTSRDCCDQAEYSYDSRFRSKVDFENICVTTSLLSSRQKKYPTDKVLQAMKTNHRNNPSLLWQYVGLESGVLINYPATKLSDCNAYDPRYRPFYKTGASPVPKDVVVLVDASKSMTGNYLQKAKDAANTVLETLNSNDRVGIVMFNDYAYVPTSSDQSCYGNRLAAVTRKTKSVLKSFINTKTAERNTNYANAFTKAFDYFKNSSPSSDRDQIILFLTDGQNAGPEDSLKVIHDRNSQLGNRVVIHTFGIGDVSTSAESLLRKISEQIGSNSTYGEIKIGRYQPVPDVTYLPEALGSFYTYTNNPVAVKPLFTLPYTDYFSNNGLIISACLTLMFGSEFIGVVCTDIKLSELVTDTSYLQEGEMTYSFIMDGFERTLVHPLLPDPRDNSAEEYEVNNIYNFETASDVRTVIESMKLGNAGSKEINTTFTQVRGNLLMEGDKRTIIHAVYQWEPIMGSNFSLCIVFPNQSLKRNLNDLPASSTAFMYHRWDLTNWPSPVCRQFARYATTEHSSVKLTPEAFVDPGEYLDTEETKSDVRKMEDLVSGVITTNPGIKRSAINGVLATEEIEKIWKNNQKEATFIVWRYLATQEGVIRVYPGVRLPDAYDFKLRPWYRRTLANRNMNVISAPYNDYWGAGKVISISRNLNTKSSRSSSQNEVTEAVLVSDFSMFYFHQMVKKKYPQCNDKKYICMIIDNSGFLVMHPFLIESQEFYSEDRQIHITNMEGRIARSLMTRNVMFRQPCLSVENEREQMTYRVILTYLHINGIDAMATEGYEIRPIRDTNLFFILKSKSNDEAYQCCSDEKSKKSPNVVQCTSEVCDCLCYKQVNFNDCENAYTIIDNHLPCSAKLPELTSVDFNEDRMTKNLPLCFPYDCNCRKNELDCYNVSGCSWCTETMTGDILENGFCALQETCPAHVCQTDDCSPKCGASKDSQEKDDSIVIIVVPIVCVLIVFLLIVSVIILYRCRQGNNPKQTYLDPVGDLEKEDAAPHYHEVGYVHTITPDSTEGDFQLNKYDGRRLPAHPPVENSTDLYLTCSSSNGS
ncbi:VWFA and cache domain-containing protein 1-like [Saccostrea echinata]|uniref:VWFA and cache domain-containing protein 1-like n=1 Tax=Saccostrea echinata TaxID=191078 RepID=UPI002A8395EA|nr:VWFA and cache domain-containing protein 1-like [Saccostrea echinata]